MRVRPDFAFLVLVAAWTFSVSANAQSNREVAVTSLRAAAVAGNVDAQISLANLLDDDPKVRNDESLGWYEKAARSGSRVAQRRYLEMRARPGAPFKVPRGAFMIRLPRTGLGEEGSPPEVPAGYHCHPLGNRQMWCHGGTDGTP